MQAWKVEVTMMIYEYIKNSINPILLLGKITHSTTLSSLHSKSATGQQKLWADLVGWHGKKLILCLSVNITLSLHHIIVVNLVVTFIQTVSFIISLPWTLAWPCFFGNITLFENKWGVETRRVLDCRKSVSANSLTHLNLKTMTAVTLHFGYIASFKKGLVTNTELC